MATRAILLSGEHPTLPAAELRALLAVHDPAARLRVEGAVAVVDPSEAAACDVALHRMAMAHAYGVLWGDAAADDAGLAALEAAARRRADGVGRAAIVDERRGGRKGGRAGESVRRLGQALADAGHPIDLTAPERRFFLWSVDGRLLFGERKARMDRSRFEARAVEKRRHFMPVSLHPRLAAALLHLARAPPGARVYDPCCGTGGILLEAALEGYDAWGSDLDPVMAQGSLQALADTMDEPLAGTAFVADVGEAARLVEGVDAIVTDLPYGRSSSTDRESLPSLYGRAFAAFAALLRPGSHAVVGAPDAALLDPLEAHGFSFVERHEERVHRSLTRHFAVVKRL